MTSSKHNTFSAWQILMTSNNKVKTTKGRQVQTEVIQLSCVTGGVGRKRVRENESEWAGVGAKHRE